MKPLLLLVKSLLLSTLFFSSFILSNQSRAEFTNQSYSYLGLGSETLTYSETSDNFGGQTFESSFTGTNLVQKSGGYTGIGDQYGFFISTSSTLLAEEAEETWDFEGIGDVQKNQMSLKRTAIDLLGVFHFQNGHYLTAGTRYHSATFSRYDFEGTEFTDNLNTALLANPNVRASEQANLDSQLAEVNTLRSSGNLTACVHGSGEDNGCIGTIDSGTNLQAVTLEQYWEIRKFQPEETQGVVFEDMTSWSGVFGWGYDTFFINHSLGMRYQLAARAGTALYENVLNTQNDKSLTRTFGGDWDVHLLAGIGYQFQKEVGMMFTFEFNGVYRSELSVSGEETFLPENTLWAYSPQITAFWAF